MKSTQSKELQVRLGQPPAAFGAARNLTQRRVQLIELHPFLFPLPPQEIGSTKELDQGQDQDVLASHCADGTGKIRHPRQAPRRLRPGRQLVRRNAPMAAMESSCVVIV